MAKAATSPRFQYQTTDYRKLWYNMVIRERNSNVHQPHDKGYKALQKIMNISDEQGAESVITNIEKAIMRTRLMNVRLENRLEGIRIAKLEVAGNLLAMGLDPEDIAKAKATGLPLEEIQKLKP